MLKITSAFSGFVEERIGLGKEKREDCGLIQT